MMMASTRTLLLLFCIGMGRMPITTGFLVGRTPTSITLTDTSTVSTMHQPSLVSVFLSSGTNDEITKGSSPFFVSGPDPTTKPDYESLHGPLGKTVDNILLSMFRDRLAEQVGVDSSRPKVNTKKVTMSA